MLLQETPVVAVWSCSCSSHEQLEGGRTRRGVHGRRGHDGRREQGVLWRKGHLTLSIHVGTHLLD